MKKVVFTDYYYQSIEKELNIFANYEEEIEIVDCTKIVSGGITEPEKLIPYVKDCDAIIHQYAKIDKSVIDAMEKCKVIARYAIGIDTVDIPAATEKGICVANVPDYCIEEVADTAMAHILNSARKLSLSRDMLLLGEFEFSKLPIVKRLSECTLALLGFGNIARNLCKKAENFFKDIVVYDPYFTDKDSYKNVTFCSLEDAIKVADVISVHIPLNDKTRHTLSKDEFEIMKDGVILVNTSRGGVIDEQALVEAVKMGKVGCCGLDVIEGDDYNSSPLLKSSGMVITPHIAWNSEGAIQELQEKVAKNVVATFKMGKPIYSLN